MLKIQNLTVQASGKLILKNLNYTFSQNKIYTIMGPNGSGKTSLVNAILGHPSYELNKESKIFWENQDITNLETEKRVKLGIISSFQSPLSLSGVTLYQLLQSALKGKKTFAEIYNEVNEMAKLLHINLELLERPLNENASGGEKKKLEILQIIMLDPKLVIFDEIDTGVDIDSLETMTKFLKREQKAKTYIIITHHRHVLKNLTPDKVIVISDGKFVKEGDAALAREIENKGFGTSN